MRIRKHSSVYWAICGLLVLGSLVCVVGCGGSSEEATTTSVAATTTMPIGTTETGPAASTTTVSLSGDAAIIAANWIKFFDGSLPATDKVGLLENGSDYTEELDTQAASPLAQAATAMVSAVTITSSTTADVTYSLLLSGQVALPDQQGEAVLQDGVWKVSAESFLALLALQQGATSTTTP